MTVTIRAAAAPPALIHALVVELAVYDGLSQTVRPPLASFAAAPRAPCEIAEWEEQPAGLASWLYHVSTFEGRSGLHVEDLHGQLEHRGGGLGKALLARLAQHSLDDGLPRPQWSMLDWASSVDFDRGLGAEVLDKGTGGRLSGGALRQLAERM